MSFHMTTRRKIALATWSNPREGNIYGKMSVDITKGLKYIDYLRDKFAEKVTITHIIGKAVGMALRECPDVNGRILFGKYISHDQVSLAFLVSLEDGKDLYKIKINNIDNKKITEIAGELRERVEKLRTHGDKNYDLQKKLINFLPVWLLSWFLWLTGFITSSLGLSIKSLGLEKYPFGAGIITSVGMFGVDEGYAPPTPFARVPLYVAITQIQKRAVVIKDEIVIRPVLDICATFDHRFLDGHRGSMIVKNIRKLLENPWLMDDCQKPY